jgi:hypothetical protein
LDAVSFTDANNGTATGDVGTILRTTNSGATWVAQSSGTTALLYGVSFTDAKNGTAVGAGGTILRTTNGGWTTSIDERDIADAHLPSSFLLEQNYPNPFNPTTVIKYQLPANNFVTLKVYDIFGRELQTLVHERKNAGTHTVTFNAAGLPSGVYFCRMLTDDFSQTRRLLLLK